MQIKQLLPVFEVTNKMSDQSVFSLVEFIWTKIYESYLPDVLEEKVSKSMFDYEVEKYLTKDEAKNLDQEIKNLSKMSKDLAAELGHKQRSIIALETLIKQNREEIDKKAGIIEMTALQFQVDSGTATKHDIHSISNQLLNLATREEVKETNDLAWSIADKINKFYYNKTDIDSIQSKTLSLIRSDLNNEHLEVNKHINDQIVKIDAKLNEHSRTMGKFRDTQKEHEKQLNDINECLKTKATINELLVTNK